MTPRPTLGSPPRSPVLPASPVERCRGRPHARPSPLELRRDGKKPGTPEARHPRAAAPRDAGRQHARAPDHHPRRDPGRSNTTGHAAAIPSPRSPLPHHLTTPSYAGGPFPPPDAPENNLGVSAPAARTMRHCFNGPGYRGPLPTR
jgi:hypothetical protein